MKKVRKLAGILLAMVMVLGLCVTSAFAADTTGSITITNATIGESYHVYKLFDATYGESYETTDSDGNTVTVIPTNYIATGTQRDALEAAEGNVFDFTPFVENEYLVTYTEDGGSTISYNVTITGTEKKALEEAGAYFYSCELVNTTGSYQVTVKDGVTDEEVVAFVKSYVVELSGGVTVCYFPEAEEYTGDSTNEGIENCVATASTIVINGLPLGYYFVTSSLGSVISLSTTNPDATIKDKNTDTPTPDNDEDSADPDDPVKSVLNEDGHDIDGKYVEIEDTLTYQISYTNNSGVTLDEVEVTDAAPEGTKYVDDTIKIYFYTTESGKLTPYLSAVEGIIDHTDNSYSSDTIYYENEVDDSDSQTALTWTIENLPDGFTLVAEFQVTVEDSALEIKNKTIVNDADLVVTIGENTYNLKTNVVENPVDNNDPVKDVVTVETDEDGNYSVEDADSIDGEDVAVGDILTYTIGYTIQERDLETGATTTTLTIQDAPPTGTVYVAGSAACTVVDSNGYSVSDVTVTTTVGSDNSITWVVEDLQEGYTVTASFQVEVTEAALTITYNTITNTADVNTPDNTYTTNTVSNPVPPEEEEEEPVKDVVIVDDGKTYDGTQTSIDGEKKKAGDILTYVITYTVPEPAANESLGTLTIVDAPPTGTTYVGGSAAGYVTDADEKTPIDSSHIVISDDGTYTITWTVNDGEAEDITLTGGEVVTVFFQVKVNKDALAELKDYVYNDIDCDETVVNDALVTMGENKHTTNLVKNPVYNPDGPDPVKDVVDSDGESIDKESVNVGDILTYTISYTVQEDDVDAESQTVDITIVDTPPAGTTYVNGSAAGTITTSSEETTSLLPSAISYTYEDGNLVITWAVEDLVVGDTVEVSFQVRVTAEALTWTYSTIENEAYATIGEGTYKTNIVKNPVPDTPQDEDFGKVIVNADGSYSTVSTGSFGDTVNFDVSIDAVNSVANDAGTDEDGNGVIDPVQVSAYYIYDKLDPGFDLDVDSLTLTIDDTEYTLVEDNTQSYTGYGVTTYTFVDGSGNTVATLFVAKNYNGSYTLIAVTIPWAEVGTETDSEGNTVTTVTALYPNCEIHLTYSATINTDAEIAGDGNYNSAYYDYSTVDDTDPIEPNPEDPTYPSSGSDLNHYTYEMSTQTYTYALGIQKVSSVTGETLEGAVFTAVDAGGNQIYAVPVTDADGNVQYYNYTADATATGATGAFTTNSDGQIIIKGVDIGTYTFTETKAPKGYVLLTDSVPVEATMTSSSSTTETLTSTSTRYFEEIAETDSWDEIDEVYTRSGDETNGYTFTLVEKPESFASGYFKEVSSSTTGSTSSTSTKYTFDVSVVSLLVANTPGSTLPTTGGIGTTIFYIVGTILVLGAVVVLITRRRMKND